MIRRRGKCAGALSHAESDATRAPGLQRNNMIELKSVDTFYNNNEISRLLQNNLGK